MNSWTLRGKTCLIFIYKLISLKVIIDCYYICYLPAGWIFALLKWFIKNNLEGHGYFLGHIFSILWLITSGSEALFGSRVCRMSIISLIFTKIFRLSVFDINSGNGTLSSSNLDIRQKYLFRSEHFSSSLYTYWSIPSMSISFLSGGILQKPLLNFMSI